MSGLIFYRAIPYVAETILPGCTHFQSVFDILFKIAPNMYLDRTGQLKGRYKMAIANPIPTFDPGFSKSFADCMDERALELAALGKTLTVAWSGGIDSTAALVSLLKAGLDDQIKVIYEPRSIDEYRGFFEKTVCKVNHVELDIHISKYATPANEIFITGDPGDCLWGKYTHAFLNNPWEAWVLRQTDCAPVNELVFVIERMREHVKQSPIPIVSVDDFFWWINFSMKWDGMMMKFNKWAWLEKDAFSRRHHFFNTPDFQQWSVANYGLRHGTDPWTFKLPAKDYIFSYTGDTEYRGLKNKEASHDPALSLDQSLSTPEAREELLLNGTLPVLIDDEFNQYSLLDLDSSFIRFMNPVDTDEWLAP